MAVVNIIEVVGSSREGSDAAVQAAVADARRSVRGISGADVVSVGLRGADLGEWRALVRVSFLVERAAAPPRHSAAADAAALRLEERETP